MAEIDQKTIIDRIRKTPSYDKLRIIEANIAKQGAMTPAVEAAIKQHYGALARQVVADKTGIDLDNLSPAEEKIVLATAEYVGLMKRDHKTASRTFQILRNRGLIGAAEASVARSKPTQGFNVLNDADRADLSFEQIIIEHPDEFSDRALWYARRALGLENDATKPPPVKRSKGAAGFLVKIDGSKQVLDGPARPTKATDWEGRKAVIPHPRSLDGSPAMPLAIGDQLWIWTHEDKPYGPGLGLTASAVAGNINQVSEGYEVTLEHLQLLKPHIRLDEIAPGSSGSTLVEAIRKNRHDQAIMATPEELAEFTQAVERIQRDKLAKFAGARARFTTVAPQSAVPEQDRVELNVAQQVAAPLPAQTLGADEATPAGTRPGDLQVENAEDRPHWVLVCNPQKWAIDEFLARGIEVDSWGVRPSDKDRFKPGQLAMVRVGQDRRSKAEREGRPPLEPGIYALCQVLTDPYPATGASDEFWSPGSEREPGWPTVGIRYLRTFLDKPLPIETLKVKLPHVSRQLLDGFQASTFPISGEDFRAVTALLGVSVDDLPDAANVPGLAKSLADIEDKYRDASPEVKERQSRYIERGPVGAKVKKLNGFKCQICDALGHPPHAFLKPNGEPYVEAHHVMPVSKLEKGSLHAANIMTLCANHHRQLHFGGVEVEITDTHFTLEVGGVPISIPRPAV